MKKGGTASLAFLGLVLVSLLLGSFLIFFSGDSGSSLFKSPIEVTGRVVGECSDGETRACGPPNENGACSFGIQTCVVSDGGLVGGVIFPLTGYAGNDPGEWGICVGAVYPSAETCNNIDDDCDNSVDESLTQGTTCGVGACSGNTGEETCTGGSWGGDTCDAFAGSTTETWNGLDDDCDGVVDDGLGGGQCAYGDPPESCFTGQSGICSEGSKSCTEGYWSACTQIYFSSSETCDGVDNDCDGTVDGQTRSTSCGEGVCSINTGTETCTGGSWGGDTCNDYFGATAEVCDGVDNDCDSYVDNTLVPFNCGTDVGECSFGTKSCIGGAWGNCAGGVGSQTEICGNGLDDDCEGNIDNGCDCNPGEIQPCGKSTGECESGEMLCSSSGTWGNCIGALEESEEICDEKDNDCDGTTDEGCDSDGDGFFKLGATCGTGYFCNDCNDNNPDIRPGATEKCDGFDNNCDKSGPESLGVATNLIDEGCDFDGDGGYSSLKFCEGADYVCDDCNDSNAGIYFGAQEICGDGIDNDCSGVADDVSDCGSCTEGETQPCGVTDVGPCSKGTRTCTGAEWGNCIGNIDPKEEVCGDNVDDDCNGEADNGCSDISGEEPLEDEDNGDFYPSPEDEECSDTDKGLKYYQYGETSGSNGEFGDDVCCSYEEDTGYVCFGKGEFLRETYCDGQERGRNKIFECREGCSEGACKRGGISFWENFLEFLRKIFG